MQTEKNFFTEIEQLMQECCSKIPTPIKNIAEPISQRKNKLFFFNKNKIDVNEAWKEVEKLFSSMSLKSSQADIPEEEHKVAEPILNVKTPQPKKYSPSLQTTKTKEQQNQKQVQNCTATRKLQFNLLD